MADIKIGGSSKQHNVHIQNLKRDVGLEPDTLTVIGEIIKNGTFYRLQLITQHIPYKAFKKCA